MPTSLAVELSLCSDRSVWVSLRSPRWWVLQALGMLPHGIGATYWLLLAFAVDKEDEYQLCQFIVALRCTHFATLGVGAALYGCVQSYRCVATVHLGHPMECQHLTPALSPFSAVFWAMQMLITTRAFLLLPYSEKKGQRVVERRAMLSLEVRRALATGMGPPPEVLMMGGVSSRPQAAAGGVLVHMGAFDLVLASLVLVASSTAALLCSSHPQLLCVTLYWIRTVHGLLSCPYLLLRLPGANTLLTHARRTGYDRFGHCVPWRPVSLSGSGQASAGRDQSL